MPPKPVLYVTAGFVIMTLLGLTALRGAPDSTSDWLAPIGPAVTVAAICLWAFDRWLWRWPGIYKTHSRPALDGTWHGQLASDWINPATREGIPPDADVFLVVRQRFWKITLRLLTKESSSRSLIAGFDCHIDRVNQLIYTYSNIPRVEVRPRSEIHYGTVVVNAPRDRTQGIEGHYFTDRKTRGEMRFNHHMKGHAETHAAAHDLFRKTTQKAAARAAKRGRWPWSQKSGSSADSQT